MKRADLDSLTQQINALKVPPLTSTLKQLNAVKSLELVDNRLTLSLCFAYPTFHFQSALKQAITKLVKQHIQTTNIEIIITSKIRCHQGGTPLKAVKGIKNIIAIASGKGGVGKSTLTANLAAAMQLQGARVGILDADIYGPSQAKMLGGGEPITKPQVTDDTQFTPFIKNGIQLMSMAYLVDANQAAIWRGPMVSKALMQLLLHTAWDNLDYLVIDLPPGTGDIQLTMAKQIPVTAACVVTTPQDIALLDARRAIAMFDKVNIQTLGIIENMSYHVCTNCQHHSALFGEGGGAKIAKESGIPLIGKLPLHEAILQDAENGTPFVINHHDHPIADQYHQMAFELMSSVGSLAINYRSQFPKMVQKNQ